MERMMILSETFPNELVVEIMKRMPVRSLLRFKSVSKSWYSQISDPQFTKSHFDLAAAPTHRILYHYQNSEFKAIDTEASLQHDSDEVVLSTPSPSLIFKYGFDITIKGSCRGFILFEHTIKNTFFFEVWNPSTGLYKQILLKISRKEKKKKYFTHIFGIGYDSSIDDYLIVTVMLPQSQNITQFINVKVKIFSFRTNSWSCTESIVRDEFKFAAFYPDPGLFFNGVLHWLVEIHNEFQDCFAKIITFDLRNKILSEIPLPHDVAIDREGRFLCLTTVRECLSVYSQDVMLTQWWIMKKYNVETSWTKFFTLSSDYYDIFFPLCFTKNDEILGSDHKALVRINKEGKPIEHRSIQTMIIFCCASCYIESLLSLPGIEQHNSDNNIDMFL